MKKSILLLIILSSALIMEAQPVQVQSAFNFHRRGLLDRAKEAIDKAAEHERTVTDPKTWFYKGNIYLAIHTSDDENYKKLDDNALDVAFEAYQKAIQLDENQEYLRDIAQNLQYIGELFFNQGAFLFEKTRYDEAMVSFEKTAAINAMFQIQDTLATFNAALSAQLAGNTEKAILYYQYLADLGYEDHRIYLSLADIFQSLEDTLQMIGAIEAGRERFPNEYDLIIAETNFYLQTGETEKALSNIQLALEQNPDDHNLYYALATSFDELGHFEQAEKNYLRAIKLDTNFFFAYYNLGALYFNKGVEVFEEADAIMPTEKDAQKRYDAKRDRFQALWEKALPYLEKANALNPDDRNTLISLSQLYARTGDYENAQRINQKLRAADEEEE